MERAEPVLPGVRRAACAHAGAAPAARPFFASTATGLVQVVSFVSVFHQYVLPVSSTTASHPFAKGSSISSAILQRNRETCPLDFAPLLRSEWFAVFSCHMR